MHSFASIGIHTIGVEVTNSMGFRSVDSFQVEVRDGTVRSIPEPESIFLFLLGLLGMTGIVFGRRASVNRNEGTRHLTVA